MQEIEKWEETPLVKEPMPTKEKIRILRGVIKTNKETIQTCEKFISTLLEIDPSAG